MRFGSDATKHTTERPSLQLAPSQSEHWKPLSAPRPTEGGRPQFSVVIPTYNYGRFIHHAIESVLSQPANNWELIVVDDGSTDDTRDIVASYGNRVIYLHQSNQGPYAACRTGLLHSHGVYLIFLDADDRLTPNALKVIGTELESAPEVGMVFGRFWSVQANGQRSMSPVPQLGSPDRNFLAFLEGKLRICTGAAAIHRDVFTDLIPYVAPIRTQMDVACIARTLLLFPCRMIQDPLLEVHQHEGRLRDNFGELYQSGNKLLDVVFAPSIVPAKALRYKRRVAARFECTRTRLFYRAGHYSQAVNCYHAAVKSHWRSLFDFRNMRRYISSLIRRNKSEAKKHSSRLTAASSHITELRKKTSKASEDHWIWGHRRQVSTNPIKFLTRCAREQGDVVHLRLACPTYLLSAPADIQHVLATNRLNYLKTGFQTDFRRFFGKGLIALESEEHLAHRRFLQPLFQGNQLHSFSDAIVHSADRLLDRWNDGDVVNIADDVMQLTVAISAKIVFGIDKPQDAQKLYHATQRSHERLMRITQSKIRVPKWMPTPRNLRYQRQIAKLEALVFEIIHQSRKTNNHSQLAGADSLLTKLLNITNVTGNQWNDRQLRDHLLTIFLAAYEPTANALTMCYSLLANHPDVYHHLIDELETVIGHRPPCSEDIAKLPYTQMVIDETLRLYPSTWLLARRTVAPDQLPSGTVLKAGDEVFISPYVVQRDPRHYPDPERFCPERFEKSTNSSRAAYVYFPFGAGPRVCVGEPLARFMMALLVATIAPRFRMTQLVDSESEIESVNLFTIQPKSGILMKLEKTTGIV